MTRIKSGKSISRARGRSDGYYHGRITLALTPFAAIVAMVLEFTQRVYSGPHDVPRFALYAAYGISGCLMGLILDPDLDQDTMMTSSEVRAKRILMRIPILGPIVFALWFGWFTVYGILTPHRGISHVPVIGTITRVIWLFPIWILLYLGKVQIPILPAICVFAGLCISDWGHYMRDYHGWQI